MEKLYTQKEYQLKAEQANKDGLFLYQLIKEQEYTIEVFEYEKKIVSQDIYSEDGEIIGSQEVEVDDLTKPIMVEEEVINPETGKKKTVMVQKHHTETRTKTVVELVIEPEGYYVTHNGNYTDGTINENFEKEKKEQEAMKINMLTMTPLDFIKVLEQAGLTLEQINTFLNSNLEIKTQLQYCSNVYCGVVKQFLPLTVNEIEITSEMVEQAFKIKYNMV